MVTKFHLFENLNYARSVLRKKGLYDKDEDFIKIREMSKDKSGYLGLLTKLHFVDNVPLDELQSIYNSLVELNINAGEALKLDYIQLSDYLMDKTSVQADNGYKFQFTDGVYDYFRVMTYEGLLNCGSPSWCIKTKSYFDKYTNHNPGKNQQWVVIKKIGKKLLTPNTNYLDKYVNTSNPYIRFGLTFNVDSSKIYAFDDNDKELNIADGLGKRICSNIKKFMKGEEVGVISYDKILGKEAIITFDKNKKLYLLGKGDIEKIEEYVIFEVDIKSTEGPSYLLTVNGQFNKIIGLEGYYVYEFDGKTNNLYPIINQKVYYEITKHRMELKKYLPTPLLSIAFKTGIWKQEEFLTKNPECSIFKNSKGREWLCVPFINNRDNLVVNLTDTKPENYDGETTTNVFFIYKNRRPTTLFNDLNNICGPNMKGFSDLSIPISKKSSDVIDTIFGLENLRNALIKFYKNELEEESEKKRVEEEKRKAKETHDKSIADQVERQRQEQERQRLAEIERQRLEQEEYDRTHPSFGRKVKNWLGFN